MLHNPCKCCLWFKRVAPLLNVISTEPCITEMHWNTLDHLPHCSFQTLSEPLLNCVTTDLNNNTQKGWLSAQFSSFSPQPFCITLSPEPSAALSVDLDLTMLLAQGTVSPPPQRHSQLCQWTWSYSVFEFLGHFSSDIMDFLCLLLKGLHRCTLTSEFFFSPPKKRDPGFKFRKIQF